MAFLLYIVRESLLKIGLDYIPVAFLHEVAIPGATKDVPPGVTDGEVSRIHEALGHHGLALSELLGEGLDLLPGVPFFWAASRLTFLGHGLPRGLSFHDRFQPL